MNQVATDAKQIFLEAVEQYAPDEWAGYLDRACRDDSELRRRVEELLTAHRQANSLLDGNQISLTTAAGSMADRPGTVVGPYKLLEQIGEGGMGLVFMADQLRPVRRRVALKVLKPGMDTRQVIARFEAERQVLALMDHSNIAHVYDAGTTESGRPYFVMELVRGVPITEYCDEYRLDTRQRLEPFITVCHAVQHAHQKGIIHRDLKPTNVLVTKNDTVAIPKVIDFGIAKATGQQLTERTLFTQFAQMIGTPLYMSPEQAEMNSLDVDTRSDVYSLGVLLYELLTGHTPFASETLGQVGLDEMRRIIREEEPPRPSHRISTLAAEVRSTVSDRRGVDPRRLSQTLRGELDWIVMKAIEKDRNRRYESVSAFAADVDRYLSNLPVDACPPSAIYRLRKLARRNRAILAMASVVTISLVTTTVVSAWQAIRASELRHQAELDRDKAKNAMAQAEAAEARATTEAAIAKAVNNFLQVDLLGQAHTAPQPGQEVKGVSDLTVREALDRAATKIDKRFHDKPLVEAAVRTAIGEAYSRLYEDKLLAVPHLERAVELRQQYLGTSDPDTLKSMGSLAEACVWAGRGDDAIALHQQILEILKDQFGTDHPDTLEQTLILAIAFRRVGRWDISLPLLEQIIEKRRILLGSTHPATLGAEQQLALNYEHVGRFSEAIAIHEKVLEIDRSSPTPNLWGMEVLARAYQRSRKLDDADGLIREALVHLRKRTDHAGLLEMTLHLDLLSVNLLLQGKYVESEAIVREALTIHENKQPDSWRRFHLMSVLGGALLGQQKYAEAEPLLLQGYEGLKQREWIFQSGWKYRITEAGERIVHFYEVTHQPETARAWREQLDQPKEKSKQPADQTVP